MAQKMRHISAHEFVWKINTGRMRHPLTEEPIPPEEYELRRMINIYLMWNEVSENVKAAVRYQKHF